MIYDMEDVYYNKFMRQTPLNTLQTNLNLFCKENMPLIITFKQFTNNNKNESKLKHIYEYQRFKGKIYEIAFTYGLNTEIIDTLLSL